MTAKATVACRRNLRMIATHHSEEIQPTTRTANVRCNIRSRRLAAGDLLSRPCDPRARSTLREVLAEAVGGGTADHGIALGRRSGVVRRRALFAVQRYS